jgi:hypothetical protein
VSTISRHHKTFKQQSYEKAFIDEKDRLTGIWSKGRNEVFDAISSIEDLKERVEADPAQAANAMLTAMQMLARSLAIVFDEVSEPIWLSSRRNADDYNAKMARLDEHTVVEEH